jgi:Family of unknown function (DUF6781)
MNDPQSAQTSGDETLRDAAAESVASGEHIRERVRDLTLKALQQRRFDYTGFREVLRSMGEGISLGAERGGSDVKAALSQAFSGMDEALTKAAQAGSLAIREMTAKGREFNEKELKQALDQMRCMEQDLLDTMRQVSQSTGGAVRAEWQGLLSHAQRAGTDTGQVVSRTLREFGGRVAATMADTTVAGMEAARLIGDRFAQAASGFLLAMSEVLKPDEQRKGETDGEAGRSD